MKTKQKVYSSVDFFYHQVLLCLIFYFYFNITFNVRSQFFYVFLVVWKVWIGFVWPNLIIYNYDVAT